MPTVGTWRKKLEERTFNTVAVVACVRRREIARIPGCGLVEGSPSLCEITDSGQPMENATIEHLVIGAGVIGLSVAAALARGGEQEFVVEAASRIGCGISSRNSEIVHSGIYYETGSLKHRLCVEGRRLLYDYCRSHRIAHRKCGKLIVAANEVEADQIVGLAKRAQQNQIERVDLIDAQAAKRLEPNLRATLRSMFAKLVWSTPTVLCSRSSARSRRREGQLPSTIGCSAAEKKEREASMSR